MTTRTLTVAEQHIRAHVLAINLGRCCLCGTRTADNFGHRLPEGRGGPYVIPNGLPVCGSGTTGCHGASERRRTLSYSCGWLLRRDNLRDNGRTTRIAATPALIRTPLAPDGAWHLLDSLENGRPLGMPRLAEPGEIPDGMYAGSLADALAALLTRVA
jgi:hypothetical protein